MKKTLLRILAVSTITILGLLTVLLPKEVLAATQCPKDPDYAAAGSYTLPTGASNECPSSPAYNFIGDANKPSIVYTVTSGSGTTEQVATLNLQDPKANPLIWKGQASYDNHTIEIDIGRNDFTNSITGIPASRIDNGSTQTIHVVFNSIGQDFARIQNLTVKDESTQYTSGSFNTGDVQGKYTCGEGSNAVHISIDIGCRGKGNPILDALFAIIRFLSIGAGLVVIASVIVAGIQYTTSRGDPQATAKAMGRIRDALIGLLIYIFIFAILNWVIPAAVFAQ